ncbi:MAG TPA: DUF2254 domain-containing protein [Chloroflexota bacterium]|nr:DUF2254 domain-containing protein [Chloroflexota bacterium]
MHKSGGNGQAIYTSSCRKGVVLLERFGIVTAQARMAWATVRDSLWFVPGLMSLSAIVLAVAMTWVDGQVLVDERADIHWLFGAGSDGAREVLSTIAGGIITVTGVVFSVTIIALQLASSQFSPRVLRNFMSDRVNQTVLGAFIGTFIYSLWVLKEVESSTDETAGFVPSLSVTVAMVLVLISLGYLIFFIDHMARTMQASTIIDRAIKETRRHIDELFPDPVGRSAEDHEAVLSLPTSEPGTIVSETAGFVQILDDDLLFRVADKGRLAFRMEPQIGEYVLPGEPLVSVWPPSAADDEDVVASVRKAFVLAYERSIEQDVEYGVVQVVDIAVKALSPSINDPTTALICIDRLAEVLVVLGNRGIPSSMRTDDSGTVLFLARSTTFDQVVNLAFDEIRRYGGGKAAIAIHLEKVLKRVVDLVPADRREPLLRQASLVLTAARRQIDSSADLARVEEAGTWLEPYLERSARDNADHAA